MNFGFVSTRFSGNDGVSLESTKWADVLLSEGHQVYWFSGLSDRPPESSQVEPRAHFEHPEIESVTKDLWGKSSLLPKTLKDIDRLTLSLQKALEEFSERFSIDVLISENALTIPMNLPLGLALASFLEESGKPAIAHHHDFYWERERFSGSAGQSFLDRAFPPVLSNLSHVVINSEAGREINKRFGVEATRIPNVMDFDASLPLMGSDLAGIREDLGFSPDDRIFLQPTRIVPRKGIEHAIELVARLGNPRNKLMISHDAGDEGFDYRQSLIELADSHRVDLRFVSDRVAPVRQETTNGRKQYTLQDLYLLADFITFPSLYEGFGNALLEAIYFRKPILVNRYSVFKEDIEPLGFRFAIMDGIVTPGVVSTVQEYLDDTEITEKAVEENFRIALQHFSSDLLRKELNGLLARL